MAAHSSDPSGPIRIRLFAALREQAGWAERDWPGPGSNAPHELPPGEPLTARRLWLELQLPGSLEGVRVAINQQFASADTPLQPGDELAFLPPISGG
jgi:molybdopterin synthase sulfur carrier subunit